MEANIEKTAAGRVGDLIDNDVNILEQRESVDVTSLHLKTVKVLEKLVKFNLESPTDSSDDKCVSKTSSEVPVDQGTQDKKDREGRAEANPEIESNEFEQGKDGKDNEPEGGRRGLYHEADEGAGEDEHDDPEQAVQPREQLERGSEERIGGKQ